MRLRSHQLALRTVLSLSLPPPFDDGVRVMLRGRVCCAHERVDGHRHRGTGVLALIAFHLGPGRWTYQQIAFDDWIFSRSYIRHNNPELERRLDAAADEIISAACECDSVDRKAAKIQMTRVLVVCRPIQNEGFG